MSREVNKSDVAKLVAWAKGPMRDEDFPALQTLPNAGKMSDARRAELSGLVRGMAAPPATTRDEIPGMTRERRNELRSTMGLPPIPRKG